MANKYIAVSDIAAELGVTKRWVQQLIAEGKLKAEKLGTKPNSPYMVLRSSYEKYKAQRNA